MSYAIFHVVCEVSIAPSQRGLEVDKEKHCIVQTLPMIHARSAMSAIESFFSALQKTLASETYRDSIYLPGGQCMKAADHES